MNKSDPSNRAYRSRAAPWDDKATHKRAIVGKLLGWGFVACAVIVGAFAARSMFLHPRSEQGKIAQTRLASRRV